MDVWSARVVLYVLYALFNSSSRPGFILSVMKYRGLIPTRFPHLSWCPQRTELHMQHPGCTVGREQAEPPTITVCLHPRKSLYYKRTFTYSES